MDEITDQIWIATGLSKRFRVCSNDRNYGEFEELGNARALKQLLIAGNPGITAMYENFEGTQGGYTITDDLGNEAEADDIFSARVAARTLVEDGAAHSSIWMVPPGPSPYETARRDERGNIELRTVAGRV